VGDDVGDDVGDKGIKREHLGLFNDADCGSTLSLSRKSGRS
jgi:hypothetical protein